MLRALSLLGGDSFLHRSPGLDRSETARGWLKKRFPSPGPASQGFSAIPKKPFSCFGSAPLVLLHGSLYVIGMDPPPADRETELH